MLYESVMIMKVVRTKVSGFCVRIWRKLFGARPHDFWRKLFGARTHDFLALLCAWLCGQAIVSLAFAGAEQD